MIDIHCHILPGVDDGAKTIEDSIAMARKAAGDGITTIIATPHHKNGSYENTKTDIIEATRKLNSRLQAEGINVNILPGQENRIYGDLTEDFEAGWIQTVHDSPYLLVELPSSHVPRYTEQLLFDLQVKQLKPIIVHPERNSEIISHSADILYNLVEKGALTQVTAASITGGFGKKIQKFTFDLIEANMVHFIASDAHNVTSRSCKLREAYEVIQKEFGNEARYYFQENAELIVNGQTVYGGAPQRMKKKKFLGIF